MIRSDEEGFTLVEILIIIIIIGILAAVAIPKYSDMRKDAADAAAKTLLAALRTSNELIYAKQMLAGTTFAYTMGDLGAGVDNLHVEHINYSNQDMKWRYCQ